MAYISKYTGSEIDALLTDAKNTKANLSTLSTSIQKSLTELENSDKKLYASIEQLNRMYNELLSLIQGGVVTPSYAILDQAILDQVILS